MTIHSLKRTIPALLLAVAAFVFVAMPANAQATRTWVSGVGDDANPCSRTAPCKTFAGAISKTAPAGEINVLDPGGFGALTITKSITVRSDHTDAGVLVSGTNGFIINAPGAIVVIEGLNFEGINTGLNGIEILAASRVLITKCVIRDFATTAIDVEPASAPVFVQVSKSSLNNNTIGVKFKSAGSAEPATGELDDVEIIGNSNSTGIVSNGTHSIISLHSTTVAANKVGLSEVTGGQILSFGDNRITGNTTNGTPTGPTPFE